MKIRKWFGFMAAGILAFSLLAVPVTAEEDNGQNTRQMPPQFLYLKNNTVYRYNPADRTKTEVVTVENGNQGASGKYFSDGKIKTVTSLAQKVFVSTGFSPNQRYLYSFQNIDQTNENITLTVWDIAQPENPPRVFDDNGRGSYSFLPEPMMLYTMYDEQTGTRVADLYDLELGQRRPGQIEMEQDSQHGSIRLVNSSGNLALWEEFGYTPHSHKLYLVDLENLTAGKKLLLTGYDGIEYISDDFQTIYYTTGETMNCLKGLSKKKKVLEDYYYFQVVDETGNAYWKQTGDAISIMDFIDDDMAKADAAMKLPNAAGMEAEAYESAIQKFNDKLMRDQLRMDTNVSIGGTRGSLYYFNGIESIKVTGNVMSHDQIEDGMDAVSAILTSPPLHSVKMSAVTSYSQVYSLAQDLLDSETKVVFITEGNVYPIPVAEGSRISRNIRVDEEEQLLYYIEVSNDGNGKEGILKAAPYTSGRLGTPVEVDRGVDSIFEKTGGAVYYNKYHPDKTDTVDVYSKGELITETLFDGRYHDGYLYYLKLEGPSYVLCRHGKGKNERIMDTAHWFLPLGNDYVAAVKDGNEDGMGDLYLWNTDGTKVLIDTDVEEVSGLMTTYDADGFSWDEIYPNEAEVSVGQVVR